MPLTPGYPIRTARLRLEPVTVADVDELLGYRGRDDVCRYLPFAPMTREVLLARLAAGLDRTGITAEGQALTLAVRASDTGTLLGDVVLFYRSAEHRTGELGYVFAPEAAGQGYATEAARAVLGLAFDQLGLHRVTARMDARNDASARLARRLGMRPEETLVEAEWFKGEWSDTVLFGLLEREWREGPGGTSNPWAIGPLAVSEIDALLDFWAVAAENDARPADSAEAVSRLLVRDPDALVVARADGRIVGSVISGWDGWRHHLYRLAVHPEVRRRGLAHALLDHAENRLRSLGATRIDAMVLDANETGGAVWAARGYTRQTEWRRWVKQL